MAPAGKPAPGGPVRPGRPLPGDNLYGGMRGRGPGALVRRVAGALVSRHATPSPAMAWSAGDVEVVTDLHDAASHPRGADRRVAFGPGTDVPAQRHRVAAGVHGDVAVVVDQRVAVQRVLHEKGDVDRIGVVADLDV